jgi:16S rRNA (guanine1207-N2)-methyltransferase
MPFDSRRGAAAMTAEYYAWQSSVDTVHGRRVAIAWKAGLPGGGDPDPAAALLAAQIPADAQETMLTLQSGSGLVAVVAAASENVGQLTAADPNIVAVSATRRSLDLNEVAAKVDVVASADARDLAPASSVDTVMLRLPKGKPRALLSIWSAYQVLKPGGRLFLAGAKQEGIKSYLRHMNDLFGNTTGLAYRKGNRVAQATKRETGTSIPDQFQSSWLAHTYFHSFPVEIAGEELSIQSRPGIFAWDRLDQGSRALIETMQVAAGDGLLDLGCGSGIVGVAAARAGAGSVTMVDADVDAVLAAERSAAVNGLQGARVQQSDCGEAFLDQRFDLVVTNPPFHQGRANDYAAGQQFVRDASAILRPGGRFYLVANRFLVYEEEMQRQFDGVETAFQDNRYKVLLGRK